MARFEYAVMYWSSEGRGGAFEVGFGDGRTRRFPQDLSLAQMFDQLGHEGWQLVAERAQVYNSDPNRWIFMRVVS